jgi:hypothetical protein
MSRLEKLLLAVLRGTGDANIAFDDLRYLIREWIKTAHELGRPIPEPRGRLRFA